MSKTGSPGPVKMTRSELYASLMDSDEEQYFKELQQEEEDLKYQNQARRSKVNSKGSPTEKSRKKVEASFDSEYNVSDIEMEDDDDDDDTLEGTLRLLDRKKKKSDDDDKIPEIKKRTVPIAELKKEPEVIEDFVRNFLMKKGLDESLRIFNDELYEKKQKGELSDSADAVPDVYMQLQKVEEELSYTKRQMDQQKIISE